MIYREAMREAQQECEAHDIHPELARRLMLEICNELGVDLYADMEDEMQPPMAERFASCVARLLENEPLGYVLGYDWFYGYKIKVNQAVLIPREETEELVAQVLAEMDEHFTDHPLVADVACGSGAIAIALQREFPSAIVYASDISAPALAVAEENAKANQAAITFFCGDMAEPLIQEGLKLDVLVCNPPYIGEDETIQTSVFEYEPHLALFGGKDGLFFYRQVLEQSHALMKEKALIAFEMGYHQRLALTQLIQSSYPEADVVCRQDLNGLDRMMLIKIGY